MNKINWWWLSYADEEIGFLGAVVVAADGFIDACEVSVAMGISPGGQVQGALILEHDYKFFNLSDCFVLLDADKANALVAKIDGESGND